MKLMLKIWAVILLILPFCVFALQNSATVKVTPLLKTTRSWDGKTISYPNGEAQITGLVVEIAQRGQTGWHEHPVPSFGVMLQGTLEVTLENGQVKRLHAGEALAEVVNTLHNGKNIGKEPVKIVVFYAGTTDSVLTIAHPEITKPEPENTDLTHGDAEKIDTILKLINERLAVAPKVAMVKWNSGSPIADPVREAQILVSVQQQATLLAIDPVLATYFFQAQINANKLYQQRLHEQWRQTRLPPFAKVPDLVLEVRPVIDALQGKLLTSLRDVQKINFNANAQAYLATRASQLLDDDVNGEVRAMALSPLLEKSYFSKH